MDQPVKIDSAFQTLEIGALGALTITGAETITNGTIKLDGGTLTDISGISIGNGAILTGKGTISAGTVL